MLVPAGPRRHLASTCDRGRLEKVFVEIAGRQMYSWRTVDAEVLDAAVRRRRDKLAATKFMGEVPLDHLISAGPRLRRAKVFCGLRSR